MPEMSHGWRPMKDAPKDGKTHIVARHEPNKHTPHGWIATILLGDDDYDDSPHPSDQIIHYNGDRLLNRFHGVWTGWMYPEEFAALSDVATAYARGRREMAEEAATKAEGQLAYWRERMRAEKCLDHGISEDGETYTPIGDVAAWQGGCCNGRMSEAEWWLGTLRALVANTPDPAEDTGWRDMATAPKHGPDILVQVGTEQMVVCWLDGRRDDGTGPGWYVSDGHSTHILAADCPTRWRHLPTPPAIEALVREEGL